MIHMNKKYIRITNKDWKERYDLFKEYYDCQSECSFCELNYNALVRLCKIEDILENKSALTTNEIEYLLEN